MAKETWPATASGLTELQSWLGSQPGPPWEPPAGQLTLGGCFVCFERGEAGPGRPGDRAWAAAALWRPGGEPSVAVIRGVAGAGYEPGLLALREGPLLAQAVDALPSPPDVLLVDATGRDHPRRAGLALHLGWSLAVPSIGVTHRPLLATAAEPGPEPGDREPLVLTAEVVGYLVRTRRAARPLAVHAGWRTDPEMAAAIVMGSVTSSRTPEPLRSARQAAREARASAG